MDSFKLTSDFQPAGDQPAAIRTLTDNIHAGVDHQILLGDCDDDSLLIKAEALGPGVCHNGFRSCFYRRFEDGSWKQSAERAYDPAKVYESKG